MIQNSRELLCVVIVFFISCATFNASGIAVTALLSSVHRMMMDASRTLLIWAFGLTVHYYVDPKSPFGEVWTDYSVLQLAGFFVIVVGQAIYGEVIRVPRLKYPEAPLPAPSPAAALTNTPMMR